MSRKRTLYISELLNRYYPFEDTLVTVYTGNKCIEHLDIHSFKDKYVDEDMYNKQVTRYTIIKRDFNNNKSYYIELRIIL